LRWTVLLALTVAWVLLFAPARLGGTATYVFVNGTSMQPTYHTGDLVVVRRQASYRVGDVVAFEAGGSVVIHRVRSVTAAGFVTRGDNRSSDDPWTPTQDQILGRPMLLVPAAGTGLWWLAERPFALAALAGMITAAIAAAPDRRNDCRRLGTGSKPTIGGRSRRSAAALTRAMGTPQNGALPRTGSDAPEAPGGNLAVGLPLQESKRTVRIRAATNNSRVSDS
jgi:signal peptidase I